MGVCATNCYFLYREGGTKVVVVDPAENGAGIFKLLSEKDFTVEAILLTHGHALAEEKKVCRTPELNLSAQMPPVVTIEADEWLTDGQTVETAGISFQVIATPGHTVGGCCYYCKEGGFLFSGDTLFEESVGRTDFPTGSMSSLVRSVKEKLFVLPEDTKVYPGHGDITTIGREKQYNPYCQ